MASQQYNNTSPGKSPTRDTQWSQVLQAHLRPVDPALPPSQRPLSRHRGVAPAAQGQQSTGEAAEFEGLYIISVAARLLRMHPQTLRKYERMGLIAPTRTGGMLRLYSEEDIIKLRIIKHLVEDVGLNLAGVEMALSMVKRLLDMRQQLTRLEAEDPVDSVLSLVAKELGTILDMFTPRFLEE